MSIAERLIARALRRAPDFVIGGAERPYLRRWFLIPRNPVFNVYLHHFLRSDDDRALHSHPWLFNVSVLLRGAYLEHSPAGIAVRWPGAIKFRWGRAWHRIQLVRADVEQPCWTLFVTGPRVRSWGFDCGGRFVHWRDFTAASDKGAIGRGCD